MKRVLQLILIVLLCLLSGCNGKKDYSSQVNTFIGTAGDGNTFPGAAFPFGSVKLSPDTKLSGPGMYGGYYYPDSTIIGFSHTHLNGVGEPEYRDILFMPAVGEKIFSPGNDNGKIKNYRSSFSHKQEKAAPGFYSVFLKDYEINAEMTVTPRCGFHRYTFPRSESSHIIIDLAYPGGAEDLYIKKISDTKIEGLRRSHGWAWDQYVYFAAEFSKPFSSLDIVVNDSIVKGSSEEHGKNVKASVNFTTSENEKILVKVGISAVDAKGAWLNLEKEIPGWDFEKTVTDAKNSWNKELGKIDVEGGTKEQQIIFYTSMYHAFLSPDIFTDADGRYRGVDHKVHTANGYTGYTVFSLWDTFRALHPLFTIINQERTNDFINSLLQMYDDGGRLPMWPLAGNYTDDMLGYHSVPVIVDAYMKNIRGYDVQKAFTAIKHSAELDKLGLKYYKKTGYLPCDRQGESVSKTLEYSYDDWCISVMAKDMGKDDDYRRYFQRAHNYINVYDSTSGFMRGRKFDRSWLEPFDPLVNSAYSEGNAYQYMFVPHDVEGLMSLMGGEENFSKWLDVLFTLKSGKDGNGNIGQYWHGNEPGHHLAYMYDYTGEPWKTQKLVRTILTELYKNSPDGLAGNEDCGQMSAWYILSSIGFYPVSPGQTIYAIGSPLFSKVTINLENGKKFTIKANNISDGNIYIRSARLNGKEYSKSYLRHEDIMSGSELVFEMGPEPGSNFGTAKNDRPFSENGDMKEALALMKHSLPITDQSDNHPLLDPVKAKTYRPGLHYDYFERFFVTTEDLETVQPVASGITANFNFDSRQKESYFGFRYTGYIKAPSDGIYHFYLRSNDGSRLFIDDSELIENDGNHGSVEEPGTIGLKAGLHRIKVNYMQCGGGKALKVSWEGPGFKRHEISAGELYTDR
jgi:predicted alpha-1,2-mannosidase